MEYLHPVVQAVLWGLVYFALPVAVLWSVVMGSLHFMVWYKPDYVATLVHERQRLNRRRRYGLHDGRRRI